MSLRCRFGLHRYRFVACEAECFTHCHKPCVARCVRCGQAPSWTWYFRAVKGEQAGELRLPPRKNPPMCDDLPGSY